MKKGHAKRIKDKMVAVVKSDVIKEIGIFLGLYLLTLVVLVVLGYVDLRANPFLAMAEKWDWFMMFSQHGLGLAYKFVVWQVFVVVSLVFSVVFYFGVKNR